MPTYCTVPARYRRIRSNSLSSSGRFAGRPDSSDHTSGPEPTALPKPSQLPKSSKPECASESLFGAVPQHGTRHYNNWPNSDAPHRFRWPFYRLASQRMGGRSRATEILRTPPRSDCAALVLRETRFLLGAGGGTRTRTRLPSFLRQRFKLSEPMLTMLCSHSVLGLKMASTTSIEWTDATWNPVTGCTKISAGCDSCYAERFSERFRGVPGHPFENGFDLTLRPERLEQPLRWREPRMIFVNSMSDLFHKEVPWEFTARVFDTMERADWHTFQVLTKRSSLMVRYLRSRYGAGNAPTFPLIFIDPTGWKGYPFDKI